MTTRNSASLVVSGISKSYGGVKALKDVSFEIEPGEIFGVIGPNGAGKSTLVDVITGFTSPTAGTIVVSDKELSGQKPHQFSRAGVVRTFQHTTLFERETVLDNMWIARVCSGRAGTDIDEILSLTDLGDYRDTAAGALAYGPQRRLEIALALVADPSLLLLDEPAAGMNPIESQELVKLVKSARQARTVLLIEHDMSVVRALCERCLVLVDGQVLVAGLTESVLKDPRVVEVYLGGEL